MKNIDLNNNKTFLVFMYQSKAILLSCWRMKCFDRPSFKEIFTDLQLILNDSCYFSLNSGNFNFILWKFYENM